MSFLVSQVPGRVKKSLRLLTSKSLQVLHNIIKIILCKALQSNLFTQRCYIYIVHYFVLVCALCEFTRKTKLITFQMAELGTEHETETVENVTEDGENGETEGIEGKIFQIYFKVTFDVLIINSRIFFIHLHVVYNTLLAIVFNLRSLFIHIVRLKK